MKKIVSIVLAIVIVLGSFAVASAANTSGWASGSPSVGGQVTVTFAVSGATVTSGSVVLSYDTSRLSLVSGQWLVGGAMMADFNGSSGVFAYSAPTGLGGNYFQATFTATSYGSAWVSISGDLQNNGESAGSVGGTVNVTVNCAHNWSVWNTTAQPDCEKEGSRERTCSICGAKATEAIPAKGHTFGAWTETEEATCTEDGSEERICSVCNKKETRSIDALGHIIGAERTVTKESTCTEHGEATGVCERCGETATVETALAPHTYGGWTETEAATCTEGGARTHTCEVCGYEEEVASLALGHDFSQGNLITEASISTKGLYEAVCSRCGEPGNVISPCACTDEATGIYFETTEGVFDNGTELAVSKIADIKKPEDGSEASTDPVENSFRTAFSDVSEELVVLNIAAKLGGENVQPKGEYSSLIPIPEGFSRNIAVYYIDDNGEKIEVPVEVNTLDGTVKINTDKCGKFAIVNLDAAPKTNDKKEVPSLYKILAYAGLGLAFIELLILLFGKRRKKDVSDNAPAVITSEKNDQNFFSVEAAEELAADYSELDLSEDPVTDSAITEDDQPNPFDNVKIEHAEGLEEDNGYLDISELVKSFENSDAAADSKLSEEDNFALDPDFDK